MSLNHIASLFVEKKSLQHDQKHSMLFFALICIFQASLQYICWTFQGARVYMEHQSIQSVANFFVIFIISGGIAIAFIAPTILSFFGKKSFIFAIALALQALSFWSILISNSEMSFFVFAIVNGAGSGLFLFARHLLELMRTNNESGVRDKFNSSVAAVNQLMLILLPFFIAASSTIVATHFSSVDVFTPVIFLLSFLLIPAIFLCFKITDSFPKFSISKKHYLPVFAAFKDSDFLTAKMYLISYGSHWALRNFVIAVAGALIAQNISTIGTSEATGAFIAWIILLSLQRFAKPSLRQQLFYIGAIGLGSSWIFLGMYPTLFAFFTLAVAKALFNPLLEVGTHLYTQQITEHLSLNSQKHYLLSNPIPTETTANQSTNKLNIEFLVTALIVRECYICVWRIFFLLLVPYLLVAHTSFEQLSTISILFAISCFLLPILGHLFFGSFDDASISSNESKIELLSRDDCFIHPSFFANTLGTDKDHIFNKKTNNN